jgi:insertion element IS1 protein InsB
MWFFIFRLSSLQTLVLMEIVQLTKEGLGIRSAARMLKISVTKLLKRFVSIVRNIVKPIISKSKIYEVDELCTYIRHKQNFIWFV